MKDVIRRRGENISSFEVETEVMSHPLVKDAAAVAVQNPDMAESAGDEEVKVVVVLEEGAALDPVELASTSPAACRAYWLPRFIEYPPGAAAHGVLQAEEGRHARGGDHGGHVGPGEGRREAQAGGPDLSPVEAVDGEARPRRRPVSVLFCRSRSRSRDHCPACGGARRADTASQPRDACGPGRPRASSPSRRTSPTGEFEPYAVGYVEFPASSASRGGSPRLLRSGSRSA